MPEIISEQQELFTHKSLQAGDIVVWSTTKGSALEEAIALLSGDDMSHAALVSQDTSVVIEQVPGGTTKNPYPWGRQGRTVTVMRREGLDMNPVMEVAEASLAANDPLSYKNLFKLTILLLMKRPHLLFTHSKTVIEGFIALFQSAAEYAEKETPNSAFCSQFVFDCYEKAEGAAGTEYALKIDRVLDQKNDSALEKLFQSIIERLPNMKKEEEGKSDEPLPKRLKASNMPERKEDDVMNKNFLENYRTATNEHKEKNKLLKTAMNDDGSDDTKTEEIHPELAAAILELAHASVKQSGVPADVKKIDQMLPVKKGESPEDRARDIESVFDYYRNKGVSPDGAKASKDQSPEKVALYALNHLKAKANLVTPGDLTRIINATKVGTFVVN